MNIHRNVDGIKVELNILNSLIGSKNIKDDEFKALIKKYPEVLKCIPLLLAVRANEIYCQMKMVVICISLILVNTLRTAMPIMNVILTLWSILACLICLKTTSSTTLLTMQQCRNRSGFQRTKKSWRSFDGGLGRKLHQKNWLRKECKLLQRNVHTPNYR